MPPKRFINPHVKKGRGSLKDLILWKVGYYDEKVPYPQIPQDFTYPVPAERWDPDAPTVTWINHSTFLIQVGGVHILTDPIYSNRCSPVPFLGPKRRHPPGIPFEELPPVDYVLISHNHYDHLDKKTVLALKRTYPDIAWCVPLALKKRLEKWGISSCTEFAWWEEQISTPRHHPKWEIKVTAVPSQHFSGRSLRDLNTTLWVGWVLEFFFEGELQKRCYFAGDTGYNPIDFKKIGEKFGQIDLSLIPIGSYSPRAFMSPVHIDPKEAIQIHREVHSRLSIGMHWKTFHLSDEPMNQPPYDLFLHLQEEGIDPSHFLILEPGHAINW